MDAAKRLEVLDWVMHLNDETLFNKVLAIKENFFENDIVAYTVLGEPLNIEQYKAKADKGIKDIEEGRYMTDDELFEDMKSW